MHDCWLIILIGASNLNFTAGDSIACWHFADDLLDVLHSVDWQDQARTEVAVLRVCLNFFLSLEISLGSLVLNIYSRLVFVL